MPQRKRSSYAPTRIPVYSLSGGVGKRAPSKRLQSEAEELDNVLCTLERSAEKRPGFEMIPQRSWDLSDGYIYLNQENYTDYRFDLFNLTEQIPNSDLWYYWYTINDSLRYVIALNYNARGSAQKLMYIYRIWDNGTWSDETPETQWDPDDPSLATYDADNPWSVVVNDYYLDNGLANYAAALALGTVSKTSREYITWGSSDGDTGSQNTAATALRIVSVGTNLLVLNTLVKAGFSSAAPEWNGTGTGNYLFNLRGEETSTEDISGKKLIYWSTTKVIKDPSGSGWSSDAGGKYIPVEDYIYKDPAYPFLGQSLADFSDLRLPPDNEDWYANNTNPDESDTNAKDMLEELYDPLHPFANEEHYPPEGRGKIYYCAGPYLSQPSGYYRIVSFNSTDDPYDPVTESPTNYPGVSGKGSPYTQRVRTPDAYSVLDKRRLPQNLQLNDSQWSCNPVNWRPRTSGNKTSNPGPSPFLSKDGTTPLQVNITAMANYRGRLYMSSGNKVFSSRLGDFEDLWIYDPANILDTDPIDIELSSNTYAEVVSMSPFTNFLFINTKGNIQFELVGSQNQVTPLTVSAEPTTFYSTAPLIDPVLMGSQIYFVDEHKLYIYFSDKTKNIDSAQEVSSDAPGYLPKNFRLTTSAPAQSMILCVDDDAPNYMYLYTNRFSGDRVLQNAFYRYILDDADEILSAQVYDNYVYCLVKRTINNSSRVYMLRCKLQHEDEDIPRLDSLLALPIYSNQSSGPYVNAVYYADTQETVVTVPYRIADIDNIEVTLGPGFESEGLIITPTGVEYGNNYETKITLPGGNYTDHSAVMYVGTKYRMLIELSKQFLRDPNTGNVIDGTLNLRTMVLRHNKSGPYDVLAIRDGRSTIQSTFNPNVVGHESVPGIAIEEDGEFVAKIFGFSETTRVQIISDYSTPLNITQIEFKGKFKAKYNSLRS